MECSFRESKLLRTKTALLQSKRLFPNEILTGGNSGETSEDSLGAFFSGMFPPDDVRGERTLTFSEASAYRSLKVEDDQYKAITDYERTARMPVYYLLYNPISLPYRVALPVRGDATKGVENAVGVRVVPARELRKIMKDEADSHTPSYSELVPAMPFPPDSTKPGAGWPLEHFLVTLLMGCLEGHRSDDPRTDDVIDRLFRRQTGAVSAAVTIRFDIA